MKKLILLAAVAFMALTSFVACNSEESEPLNGCLVTTKGSDALNFHYKSDLNETFFVANKNEVAASGTYTPKDGQRATILFTKYEDKEPGYTYKIRLLQVTPHYTEDAVIATTPEQLAALTDKADKISYEHRQDITSYLSTEFFSIRIGHRNNDLSKHKYHLIYDKVNPTQTNPDYLDLKLVHQNDGDSPAAPRTEVISFNISNLGRELGNKKGINLTYFDQEAEKEISVLIDKAAAHQLPSAALTSMTF